MTTTNDLLMQDIVFLMKRFTENSFYCESLDLCQEIGIKIEKVQLIEKFSDNQIKQALENLSSIFFYVQNTRLSLIAKVSFSEKTIYFCTYQYFFNELEKIGFNLEKLIENLNSK